jgi:HSF-type DNA-binding
LLCSILEDEKIQNMINWIADGSAFRVASPSEFSRIVLPTYFKHANWQSFVRQLNMYGFHKVTNSNASPDDPQSQVWEFRHPNFRRGEIHLLSDIKRKSSRHPKQHQQQSHNASLATRDSPDHDNSSNTSAEGMAASGAVQGHDGYMRSGDDADSISTPAFDNRSRLDSYAESAADAYARGPETGVMPIHASPHAAYARDVSAVRHCEARVDDLSDRIDAIIRHSSYLESQLRYVSEQLRVSQHTERLVRKHSLEAFGRLSGFCTSMHRGDERDFNVREYRSGLLEAIQREVEQLHSLNALAADQ